MKRELKLLKLAMPLILMAWIIGGCAAGGSAQFDAAKDLPAPMTQYVIGPADVLSISVLNHSELDRTVTVRPDGRISYSLVGEIQAAGLTPPQLQDRMTSELGKYVKVMPGEVSVVVDSVHSYIVSVLGEVRDPGRFEFQNQATVLDALAQAGGLTEFASRSKILILRTNQGKTQRIRFDYDESVKLDSTDPRVLVYPGDIIVVH